MNTSQNLEFIEQTESESEKRARLNRLRAAEIHRELKAIDGERIRPLAAIVAGTATDFDREKLSQLEQQAARRIWKRRRRSLLRWGSMWVWR